MLGVSVSLGEHEVHWRTFLKDLQSRGLRGVELVVSDDHLGLKAARQAVFGGLPWQRCQFHLQQNAQAYVPRHALKAEVAADIRAVFNASDRLAAEALLAQMVAKYAAIAPKLAEWMETNIPEGLTVFAWRAKQRRLRGVDTESPHQTDLEEYRDLRRVEIGANVRRARERAGWSQQQVAEILRYSRSFVHRVEQGFTDLAVADLEVLSIRFGVPLRVLIGGDLDLWDKP